MVIQGDHAAAACVLPLSENTHLSSDLGTRHRAGVGMSEVSDAVVVIVSEESGAISVAQGDAKRYLPRRCWKVAAATSLIADEADCPGGVTPRGCAGDSARRGSGMKRNKIPRFSWPCSFPFFFGSMSSPWSIRTTRRSSIASPVTV